MRRFFILSFSFEQRVFSTFVCRDCEVSFLFPGVICSVPAVFCFLSFLTNVALGLLDFCRVFVANFGSGLKTSIFSKFAPLGLKVTVSVTVETLASLVLALFYASLCQQRSAVPMWFFLAHPIRVILFQMQYNVVKLFVSEVHAVEDCLDVIHRIRVNRFDYEF